MNNKFLVFVLMVTIVVLQAFGEEPAIQGTKVKLDIEQPGERLWSLWGNKLGVDYYGTYDHTTVNRAYIKDPWGTMMEMPLFYFSPPDLSYMLTKKAKFPETVTEYRIKEDGRNKLIDLKVDELPLGEFSYWKNKGELGGGFHSMNDAPVVEMIKGRKGLKFSVSKVGHIDPEYKALTSDFVVKDYLGKNKPFTMSAWVYKTDESDVEEAGTLMSWHSMGGDHGTRLSFTHFNCDIGGMSWTSRGQKGEGKGALGLHGSNAWQHVTYVYTGGMDGELRIYTDGRLVSKHTYDNIVHRRPLEVEKIGTTNAVIKADLYAKSGKASVGLYYGEKDLHYWYQLRHHLWQREMNIAWAPEGEVRFNLDDLKPGTKYFYRIMSIDMDADWWSYNYNPMRRWSYGPGVFVTATEDGKPGYNVPEDTRKHFFIGANWGSRWYYAYPGPADWFDGHIGDMQLFDYAMDDLEVRMNGGLVNAFDPVPADDAALMKMKTGFSWEQGSKGVAKYKVYRSTDREKVVDGTAEAVITDKKTLDDNELNYGTRYYWRVAQLDKNGTVKTPGEVWTFRTINGEARLPNPEEDATINPMYTFTWTPGVRGTKKQDLYIAESVEELAKMEKPTAVIESRDDNPGNSYTPGPDKLTHGKTYYWRVDTTQADGKLTPGQVWQFHVRDYFTAEPDSIIPEPLPDDYKQAVAGAKMMEPSMGFPGLVSPGADNDPLLQTAIGTRRYLEKSRDVRDIVYFWNCGHVLGSFEGSGYARGFMTGSYGGFLKRGGKEILGILLFHETGHQIHGVFNSSDPAFRMINRQVWLDHADDNADLGGYGANNEFEQMAVAGQAFMTAGPRDTMYRKNRSQYIALQKHMPGDLCIELDTHHGLDTDENGVLQSWKNSGGLLAWDNDHWANIDGSVGTFSVIGSPKVKTVHGVPAVTFTGNEALEWDLTTKYGLYGNRDFSIELWALKNEEGAPNQLLAGWGDETNGARFFWGSDETAYQHCGDVTGKWKARPALGEWQHIVHVFRGGGKGNEAGPYQVYVNGKLVQEGTHTFSLGENARVCVAGVPENGTVKDGFKGSLANVRIYNYDISHWQIAEHFEEESDFYRKPIGHVADTLYVDMDARRLADVPRREHNPLYPEKMHRPWLRSWANLGTLSGRLHNDIHAYMWGPSHSTPTPKNIAGITAPVFGGKDRMVSGFMPDTEMLANEPGTLEAWVYSDAVSSNEVVLEWGDFILDARFLKKGWQHVGLVFQAEGNGTTVVYINGEKAGELDNVLSPKKYERLHVGGHYDPVRWNWKRYFNGSVAELRVHKGRLTPAQIADNFKNHSFNQAHNPKPAIKDMVVAERKPLLSWAPGVVNGVEKDTVYLGETPDSMKVLGEFAPGTCTPALEPGRQYYWRVGNGDTWQFATRKGVLVDLDAGDLQEGELMKWENKGAHAAVFVPGKTPDSWTPVSKKFRGTTGIDLVPGRRMESTFSAPAEMANGSFSIYYRAVRPIRHGGIPILSWGKDNEKAVFAHTTDAPFSWRGNDNTEHKIDRYPEEERGRQLATISAMAWHWKSICITYADGTFKYYCDGRLVNEVKQEFSLADADKLIIGGMDGVECILKELKVFTKELTPKEVASLTGGNENVASGALAVSVTAPDQTDGIPLPSIKNTGLLKGEFVAIAPALRDHIPSVKMIDGVKCAYFNGGSEFLESDTTMPDEFAGTHPFTVETMIKSENQGSFLALAPEVAADGHGADNIGRHLDFSRRGIRNHWGRGLQGDKWTHVALVYDGGYRSTFKVYVDGELMKDGTKTFTSLATIAGYPMYVGSLFNTYSGVVNPYRGGIASLKAYDYVRTPEEIAEAAAGAMEK